MVGKGERERKTFRLKLDARGRRLTCAALGSAGGDGTTARSALTAA